MAKLSFKELKFQQHKGYIRVFFLNIFYFDLERASIEKIGKFRIEKNSIRFMDVPEKRAGNRFRILIDHGFESLTNIITRRKAVYIHERSGIPLIGSLYFGLIDRNTSLIEIRPITGCNLDCIYCSLSEGRSSSKGIDFVVEEQYMIKEFTKLVKSKKCADIEAHINPQGEPLLYEPIVRLVDDLSKISEVKRISLNTNGTLLTKKLLDELAGAGLSQLNISLNAIDSSIAEKMAGCSYNTEHVLSMIEYIKSRIKVVIAPVWLPGVNDKEIERIIRFCKDNSIMPGIQNFLGYKHGRRPGKPMPMTVFISQLMQWEKKYKLKLVQSSADYGIVKTIKLEKPFRKMDRVRATIVSLGRLKNEMLAAAKGRLIAVQNCTKSSGSIAITIRRTKHNVYTGIC